MEVTGQTLLNPQTGNLAFSISPLEAGQFDRIQRLNYYSLIWVQSGIGRVEADGISYDFAGHYLFAFAPYQPFVFRDMARVGGVVIHFHPDFFCIHKHQDEVACNGTLFNNIYKPPFVLVDSDTEKSFELVTGQISAELKKTALGQYELLLSYLKVFLITASRLKKDQQPSTSQAFGDKKEPFILQNLKSYIEQYFKTKHAVADYASLLFISPRALGKITKKHFNKTITDLISERIIIEAKRELYLSDKTVKEIAWELGYEDEFYFSRFFKNNTQVSPQLYRDTVGFDKGDK
jgi:AraC family transcriptional regulator, transcriptional activator of pobA